MKRTDLVVPGLFVIAAAAARLVLFSGLYGHDDWVYLYYIRSFLNGQTDEILHSLWGLRFGIWLPVVATFRVFGVTYAGAFAPGFLLGLATVPVAYAAIRQLKLPAGAAALGCLVLVLNPIDWMVASTLRGDIEMSFYGGVLLLLLIAFGRAAPGRRVWLGLAAGIVWGLAAITKEWGYVFAWGILAVALLEAIGRRRLPWEYAAIGAGLGAVLAVDALILGALTGDWLARVHTSLTWYQATGAKGEYAGDVSTGFAYLPELLLGLRTEITVNGDVGTSYPYFGPYMWLLLAALPLGFSRRSAARPVAYFIAGVLLWMEFGSMSWSEYLPFHKEPRYLAVVSVPLAVLVAAAGARAWGLRSRIGRGLAAALAAGILVATVRVALVNHRDYVAGRDTLPVLLDWLEAHPAARLWTIPTFQNEVDLRTGYRFSDPVHGHRGAPGCGSVMDAAFWAQHREGDYVLVQPDWRRSREEYPWIRRGSLRFVRAIAGPRTFATLYQAKAEAGERETHYLSDDIPVRVNQNFGPIHWDETIDRASLRLDGVTYAKGIAAHAPSEIVYGLDGRYTGFSAEVGLDDDADRSRGSVVFAVYGDGALKCRSPLMRWNSPTVRLRADVTGVNELRLVVEDGGDGVESDHADWVNVVVSARGPAEALPPDAPPPPPGSPDTTGR